MTKLSIASNQMQYLFPPITNAERNAIDQVAGHPLYANSPDDIKYDEAAGLVNARTFRYNPNEEQAVILMRDILDAKDVTVSLEPETLEPTITLLERRAPTSLSKPATAKRIADLISRIDRNTAFYRTHGRDLRKSTSDSIHRDSLSAIYEVYDNAKRGRQDAKGMLAEIFLTSQQYEDVETMLKNDFPMHAQAESKVKMFDIENTHDVSIRTKQITSAPRQRIGYEQEVRNHRADGTKEFAWMARTNLLVGNPRKVALDVTTQLDAKMLKTNVNKRMQNIKVTAGKVSDTDELRHTREQGMVSYKSIRSDGRRVRGYDVGKYDIQYSGNRFAVIITTDEDGNGEKPAEVLTSVVVNLPEKLVQPQDFQLSIEAVG